MEEGKGNRCAAGRGTQKRTSECLHESKKTLEQKARARGRGGKGGLSVDRSLLFQRLGGDKPHQRDSTESSTWLGAPTEHQDSSSPSRTNFSGRIPGREHTAGATGTQVFPLVPKHKAQAIFHSSSKYSRQAESRYHAPANSHLAPQLRTPASDSLVVSLQT
jgi:hypothetical protein